MNDRTPYATRSLPSLVKTLAKVVEDDVYLNMTRKEFIATCMKECKGFGNPQTYSNWYDALMSDAGLKPLEALYWDEALTRMRNEPSLQPMFNRGIESESDVAD